MRFPRKAIVSIIGFLFIALAFARAEEREVTNSIGVRLVRIEPGTFSMGQAGPAADYRMQRHPAKFDDADWDEHPVHRVTISTAFYLGATEVTVAQYRQFRKDAADSKAAGDEAARYVSWNDATAFCAWLSAKEKRPYRLPTEAEWEYACRAGTTTLFHTGDALPAGFQQWVGGGGFVKRFFPEGKLPPEYRPDTGRLSLKVGQTPANAWGLFDMHGNVAEWCADWYGPYEAADQTDPLGRHTGDFRVIRGGSHGVFTRLLRSANRGGWLPDARDGYTGFRVVLGVPPHGELLPAAAPPLNARNVSQSLPKSAPRLADVPFFSGPKPFVKIPPNSAGPLFSVHNHSPAIAECANGDLLAVWYSCVEETGSELCNVASRLRAGASEWEPASPFWDGPDVNDHAPKLWWDGDQTLFHFARGHEEDIVRTSTDNGATWSPARMFQPMGELGNGVLPTREGFLVITVDTPRASLVISRDHGMTWVAEPVAERLGPMRPGGKGPRHPGIHAAIVQLNDGRLLAASRLNKPEERALFDNHTPFSYTADWGKTWSYTASPFPAISSVQRAVLMRLREGPLLFCSFTDQWSDWKNRRGLPFKAADGSEFTGFGLFAALSFDDGQTWPVRKLIAPGGAERTENAIDRVEFTLSDTMAEPCGYLAACQTRDGAIQLITSKNHYVFNLAWLKALPTRAK
jgi:formylglycine-generating enzyme required for sulfatase activity